MSLLDTIKKMFGKEIGKEKRISYYEGKVVGIYSVDKFGNRNGPYEEYDKNGRLKRKGIKKKWLFFETNEYEEYDENGRLKRKAIEKQRPFRDTDEYEEYYKNGQVKKKGFKKITPNPWGKDSCLDETEYYENGQVKGKIHEIYMDTGPWDDYSRINATEYYENGQVKRHLWTAVAGDEENWSEYYENGQVKKRYTRMYGKLNGPYKEYYENGRLAVKCTYEKGEKDGPYKEYDENGRLREKGVYEMGYRVCRKKYPIQAIKQLQAEKKQPEEKRKGLCARLAQMDKQMPPTQLRQSLKRAEVANFRAKFPKESVKKKNWLQKLFRGGR